MQQTGFARTENIDRFFTAIKNLNQLDHTEIHNTVSGQLKPSALERFMTLNYHRAEINVELLLTLTDTKQWGLYT